MPPTPRSAPRRPSTDGGADRTTLLWVAAGVALLVVAVVVWLLVGRSDGVSQEAAADAVALLEGAGCTVKSVPALAPGDHSLTDPTASSPTWNTDPPTSGGHNDVPAVYGKYTEPLNQAQVVHNLEHGAVAIQYGPDVPEETVAQLEAFYDDHPNGTLLAPYPKLGDKIALGVWTTESGGAEKGTAYLATCTDYDEEAFVAFLDAFQFQGPERFPPDSMLPGNT